MNATKKMTHKDYFTALLDMPEVMNYPGMTEFIEGRIAALEKKASGIIVVHNHPSGSALPGTADIQSTKQLDRALKACDISLVDHVVIAQDNYYSFADEELVQC